MLDFSEMIAQGAGNAWFFIPSAVLLGALHGLEPGHSKTMMGSDDPVPMPVVGGLLPGN
jgi:nickel/cobalt exporter|tara:strand:+ start:14484 stop:14660 length:177 start_codon:yes stop_codon:yes gene_type:complete